MYHNNIIDRLANIFINTSDVAKVWNIVKQVKAKSSNNDKILDKVSAVEETAKIATSESVFENMPMEHLKTAAEMFVYLNIKVTTKSGTKLR